MGVIAIEDIAYVRFSAPDLGEMRAFLDEFGLSAYEHADGRLYARGRDGSPFLHITERGEPRFIGLGLRARSPGDLHTLAHSEHIPVEALSAPGGGQCIRLTDPDGFGVEVVAGQEFLAAEASRTVVNPMNTSDGRRRVNQVIRTEPGPSRVERIGHCGLGVLNFQRSERWYKDRFGLLTSDEVEAPSGVPVAAFLRCDAGQHPVDHHTLVLCQVTKRPRLLHAAFEVANFDDLMVGHDHLERRRRRHVWGVGRHVLGSQIFDYWRDPWGHDVEHWTDGDAFTSTDPPGKATLAQMLGVQWGPALRAAPGVDRSSS